MTASATSRLHTRRPDDDDDGPAPADDVSRAAAGGGPAFEAELLRWLPAVARFASSLTRGQADADDLVQETYLRAVRGAHTFHQGADARRWLFTICKRAFLLDRARDARMVDVDGGEPELDTLATVMMHVAAQRSGVGDLWDRLELGPAIAAAMARLPASFRAVALLVDVEGYGYDDAAAVLDIPVGTVRSRLFRARRLLQESLFEHARDAGFAIAHPAPASPAAPPAGARANRAQETR